MSYCGTMDSSKGTMSIRQGCASETLGSLLDRSSFWYTFVMFLRQVNFAASWKSLGLNFRTLTRILHETQAMAMAPLVERQNRSLYKVYIGISACLPWLARLEGFPFQKDRYLDHVDRQIGLILWIEGKLTCTFTQRVSVGRQIGRWAAMGRHGPP